MKVLSQAKRLVKKSLRDHVLDRAAAMSFYTLFAVAPLLWLSSIILSVVYDSHRVVDQTINQLSAYFSPKMLSLLESLLREFPRIEFGRLSNILSLIFLLIGASGGFFYLRDSIQVIFKDRVPESSGWLRTLIAYGISFATTTVLGAFIFCLSVVNLGLGLVLSFIKEHVVDLPSWTLSIFQAGVFVLFLSLAITLLIQSLSSFRHDLKRLFAGALIMSVLLFFGKYIFQFYFHHSFIREAYAPIESIFMLVLWIYYSSIAFFVCLEWVSLKLVRGQGT